jgi:hypothetical protein
MVLAAALLGCVLPQAASAEEPSPSAEAETYSVCPAKPGVYECLVEAEPLALTLSGIRPEVSPALEGGGELKGLDPENLKSAYNLPATGGSGETIAIVDADNDPDAESDLQKYREKYKVYYNATEKITACTEANGCFKKLNQKGENKNYPSNSVTWSVEISLDLDMASAVCPECHIDLVEANKEGNELDVAEEEAASLKPAVISNSWGRAEESAQTERDVYFHHPGIPVVAASGDDGYKVEYPAASPDVIAAGGTTLKKAENARGWTETVWTGTGSGCSKYEEKPPWQTDKACTDRTDNDVAADASEESPLSVYDSYEYPGWELVWGTSAATPIISGIEAQASSATRSLAADAFYKKPSMLFHISEGSNGTCTPPAEDEYFCHATKEGYNGPTGEGTPDKVFESAAAAAATGFATKVAGTEATVSGIVNPNGLATKYYVEYGTTKSVGSKTAEVSVGSGTSNLEESKAITGLKGSTKYYFRLVATNSNGTTDGLNEVFTTTSASKPYVETKPATSVGAKEATLNGIVNPEGQETKYYFEYGQTTAYGTKTAEASAGSGTSNVEESKAITGLEPEKIYDFRIVATNGTGTSYGSNQSVATGWAVQPTPNPTGATNSFFWGVSCPSSGECIAVGTSKTPETGTLAERWNGTEWSLQSTPNQGSSINELRGVSCSSSSECTAVGVYWSGSVRYALAERWNGTEWKIQLPPSPTGAKSSGFYAVACTSSTACTAVGTYENSAGYLMTLAEAWNGTEWTIQETKNPYEGQTYLEGVSCTSSSWCTAVGSSYGAPLAEHWNGTAWAIQETPKVGEDTYLRSMSCSSSTACTAFGESTQPTKVIAAERWNGTEWKAQEVPSPTGAKVVEPASVSCGSSTACTGVGWYENSSGTVVALAERWNGTEWSIQKAPTPAEGTSASLLGVSCASSTTCDAVGGYGNSAKVGVNLAELYD